jgi:dTDP-glucose 4,6-dehydratase
MDVLVTGGAGFIGSNFVRHFLARTRTHRVVNLDKLTYAGNLESLKDVEARWGAGAKRPRYAFVRGDVCDGALVERLLSGKWKAARWKPRPVGAVFHFAAESHVDRSLRDAAPFLRTNVAGTHALLEAARRAPALRRFLHISTDEIYGSLGPRGKFSESSPLAPRSPYAASKAAADLLVQAYVHTYGIPAVITRSSNNYGPYQFPEKFIPLMVTRLAEGRDVPIYGRGLNVRDWLYVEDHCGALMKALRKGGVGRVYNIGGRCERRNVDVARQVLRIMKKPKSLLRFVADRPGHDFRYALDARKAERELGWKPRTPFAGGLRRTVEWYEENSSWVRHVASGAYRKYFKEMYGWRGMDL